LRLLETDLRSRRRVRRRPEATPTWFFSIADRACDTGFFAFASRCRCGARDDEGLSRSRGSGLGAVTYNGEMIEAATIRQAKNIIDKADLTGM
jgi:citrate lyase beta subunit